MPDRALSICNHAGCNVLLHSPGYCIKHTKIKTRKNFDSLPSKTPEQEKFYNSVTWRNISICHRRNEPLCRRCKSKGIITKVQLVHHEPDYNTLIAKGLSPYCEEYLVSLCNNCHLEDLRKKKINKSVDNVN